MFQAWRLQLREAEEALRGGRLDEAGRLLREGGLNEYHPGRRLTIKVAEGMTERARRLMMCGDTSAGWHNLENARSLVGETDKTVAIKHEMIDNALGEAESYLQADDPSAAIQRLARLERRQVSTGRLRTLMQVAEHLKTARNYRRAGRFHDALAKLESASVLRPDLAAIQEQQELCRAGLAETAGLVQRLHHTMEARAWNEAVAVSDQLLAICPAHRIARDARARAWAAVGAELDDVPPHDSQRDVRRAAAAESERTETRHASTNPKVRSAEVDTVAKRETGPRFLLWVDAVGGYLVCLGDEVMLGQAVPGTGVEVPILADLSRRHAKIRRDGEGYVVEPYSAIRVNGKWIQDRSLLRDGDEIELGKGVRLRFHKPHALSATARLDFASRHRTQPAADGILLMAESCVLGPRRQNHIVCRDWKDDIVLYRQGSQLCCRSSEPLEIDGQLHDAHGQITRNSRVTGNDFALSLEEI